MFQAEDGIRDYDVTGVQTVCSSDLSAANPGRTVAVGCHGGVVSAYLSHVLGIDSVLFYEARYTSISRVAASSSGHRTMRSVNELGHLQVAGVPLHEF